MKLNLRTTLMSGALLSAVLLLASCNEPGTTAQDASGSPAASPRASTHSLSSGSVLNVTLAGTLSSESANVGDAWHGTLTEAVQTQGGSTIPAGSDVEGVVARVTPAQRGSRAMLELGVRRVHINGSSVPVFASSEPVIAGSTRARNVGAIAGGAVAGALLGKVVGDGKNAAVGGVIGGAAATGVVAGSKGYQVVLPDLAVIRFVVSETVALR